MQVSKSRTHTHKHTQMVGRKTAVTVFGVREKVIIAKIRRDKEESEIVQQILEKIKYENKSEDEAAVTRMGCYTA